MKINKNYILYALILIMIFLFLRFFVRNSLLIIVAMFIINIVYNRYIKR